MQSKIRVVKLNSKSEIESFKKVFLKNVADFGAFKIGNIFYIEPKKFIKLFLYFSPIAIIKITKSILEVEELDGESYIRVDILGGGK